MRPPYTFRPSDADRSIELGAIRSDLLAGRHVSTLTLSELDAGAGIACGAGATIRIEHGLGRIPIGWIVARRISGNVGGLVEAAASTDIELVLTNAAACTFTLWVF